MSDGLAIFLGIALLLLNALFVGAEFSLLSSRRDRLEALLAQGIGRARIVIKASQEGSLMLTSAQLGITLCSLGLGRLGEPAVAHQLQRLVAPLPVPEPVLHSAAFAIALAVVVVLHVMIGEMVPKNLAISDPERLALWLVPPLVGFVKVARPLIALFNMLANGVLRLLRVEPKEELETAYTSAELAELLVESAGRGCSRKASTAAWRRLCCPRSTRQRRADPAGGVEDPAGQPERRRRRAGRWPPPGSPGSRCSAEGRMLGYSTSGTCWTRPAPTPPLRFRRTDPPLPSVSVTDRLDDDDVAAPGGCRRWPPPQR